MYVSIVLDENTFVFGNILPIGVVEPKPRSCRLNASDTIFVVDEAVSPSISVFTPYTQENGNFCAAVLGIAKKASNTEGFGMKRYENPKHIPSAKILPAFVHCEILLVARDPQSGELVASACELVENINGV